jgi:tetratricopeptide (TPR) repeat protein
VTAATPRQRPAVWKLAAVAGLAMLLIVMVLPGAARADGISTRDTLTDLVDTLYPANPADEQATKHFDKAIEKLMKALDKDDLWTAGGEPDAKKGKKVFKEAAAAAKELVKAGQVGDAEMLVDLLRSLAVAAMGDPAGEKSAKHLAKGDEDLAKGKPDKAIDDYAKAWKYAMKAAGAPGAGDIPDDVAGWLGFDFDGDALADFPGSGTVYTFQFFNTTTFATIVVSGWSEGNEGFLNSTFFAATDTYTGTPGQMQVHVSCSDAFAGGIGQKSDPEAGSQWLVDYAHIAKYKNGVPDKTCNLVGFDSGIQGPGGGAIG